MLIHTAECLQSKYYCNSSCKSKIFDQPSSKTVLAHDYDNDRQPEMTVWPPKPEIFKFLKLRQIESGSNGKCWGIRPQRAQRKCSRASAMTTDNWNGHIGPSRFGPNLAMSGTYRCRNRLATLLSSSPWLIIPICCWNYNSVSHGLGGHIAISDCPSLSKLLFLR